MLDQPPPTPGQGGTPRWLFGAVVAATAGVALLALIALVLVTAADDNDETSTDTTSTTAASITSTAVDPTSTSAAPTTVSQTTTTLPAASTSTSATSTTSPATSTSTSASPTSTAPPTPDPAALTAVWPWPDSDLRYDDPVAAALGFATDFVGFENPVAGPFQAGDTRSGEVEIRAVADGPITVVFVRQLTADDSWWVLGSATGNILIEDPDALSVVDDPAMVAGRGRAPDGVVEVQIRADGASSPIGSGTVPVSGDAQLGSFAGTIAWTSTTAEHGAVVFLTRSEADGTIREASVVRVALEEGST